MARVTTLLYTTDDGNKIDLTKHIVESDSALISPDILEAVTGAIMVKNSNGLVPHVGYKRIVNPLITRDSSTNFKAKNLKYLQWEVELDTTSKGTIINRVDATNIYDLKQIGAIGAETISQYRIRNLFELLTKLVGLVENRKIYSSRDANGAPAGIQPKTATTTEDAIIEIENGRYDVRGITDYKVSDNFDKLVGAAIDALVKQGSPTNIEKEYPFNTGAGASPANLVILTSISGARLLSNKFTQTIQNVNDGAIKYNALVGKKDTVDVLLTNLLPAGVDAIVMNRTRVLKYLSGASFGPSFILGEIKNGAGYSAEQEDGSVKVTSSDEGLVSSNLNANRGVEYHEEAIIIGGADPAP